MSVSPVETLLRWEQHGAIWRATSVTQSEAVVELCTCAGEPVDHLRSGDAALLRFLAERRRREGE